eukprot:XP_025003516.1 uncharacterized protein LOC112531803 [Gallus gallus]
MDAALPEHLRTISEASLHVSASGGSCSCSAERVRQLHTCLMRPEEAPCTRGAAAAPRRGGSRLAPGRPPRGAAGGGPRCEGAAEARPGRGRAAAPSERGPGAGRPLGRLPARPRGHRFPGRGWEPNGGAGSGRLSLGAGGRRADALDVEGREDLMNSRTVEMGRHRKPQQGA